MRFSINVLVSYCCLVSTSHRVRKCDVGYFARHSGLSKYMLLARKQTISVTKTENLEKRSSIKIFWALRICVLQTTQMNTGA